MGHRSLIGKTLKDGKVEIYYSHWGACETHDHTEEPIQVPKYNKLEDNKKWKVKNKKAFGKEIDYLFHEAVWLDGVCHIPLWVYPNNKTKSKDWKTKGYGILIKADNGKEFNEICKLGQAIIDITDDLTDLSIKDKIKLIVNNVCWEIDKELIPAFSPFGYKVETHFPRHVLQELKEKNALVKKGEQE
jgi:hypothetical protein